MKKFWLVLLSLGLVMAFSVSAFAVDVQVSGEYYAAGVYLNKTTLDDGRLHGWRNKYWEDTTNPSTAFFFQRLRVGTDFVVSPSLKLVTRFDAMERIWGGERSPVTWSDPYSAGTSAESENIAFDLVYIDYTSPIGEFKVGYQPDYVFGTVFGDRYAGTPSGQIQYFYNKGPFTLFLGYAKEVDNSYSYVSDSSKTDRDLDSYRLAGIYNFKNGEVGALLLWNRDATAKSEVDYMVAWNSSDHHYFLSNVYVLDPYVKAKIGPVALQAEVQYWFGDAMKWEDTPHLVYNPANVSVSALSVFIDATADFGMFYAGGSFAYLSGQDPNKKDTVTGGINTAGLDWNPCLILFNQDVVNYWVGGIGGHDDTWMDEMSNAWFFQGRVGIKPTPKWNAMLSISYATADQNGFYKNYLLSNHVDIYPGKTYGTEVDITATYKITNNLSYMLGAGYLFTGDYFKGQDRAGYDYSITNDYMLINKLTLNF